VRACYAPGARSCSFWSSKATGSSCPRAGGHPIGVNVRTPSCERCPWTLAAFPSKPHRLRCEPSGAAWGAAQTRHSREPRNRSGCRLNNRRGGPGTRGPSPDARIATAPASGLTGERPDPSHNSREHRSANYSPAIRAPASYRVAALAGSSEARSDLCIPRSPGGISVGAGSR
jgi:hypothetical protein